MKSYLMAHALLPQGWRRNVRVDVAPDGRIEAIEDSGKHRDSLARSTG